MQFEVWSYVVLLYTIVHYLSCAVVLLSGSWKWYILHLIEWWWWAYLGVMQEY